MSGAAARTTESSDVTIRPLTATSPPNQSAGQAPRIRAQHEPGSRPPCRSHRSPHQAPATGRGHARAHTASRTLQPIMQSHRGFRRHEGGFFSPSTVVTNVACAELAVLCLSVLTCSLAASSAYSAPNAVRLLGGCLLSVTATAWAWRLPPSCSDLRYVHEAVAAEEGAASTDRDPLTAAAGRAGRGRRPRGGRRAGPRRWRSWCGGRAGRRRRWAGARRRVAGARWRGR